MALTGSERTIGDAARAEVVSVVRQACSQAGLDAAEVRPMRSAGALFLRLAGEVVARVDTPGRTAAARRALAVSRWLTESDIAAPQCLSGLEQPIRVHGHAVTFWHALPAHRRATPAEVGGLLARLHRLPPPTAVDLAALSPFSSAESRVRAAATLDPRDRRWLREHVGRLRYRWTALPEGEPWGVVHGDARSGTIAVGEDGRVLLRDIDHVAIGPPEWDAIGTAVALTSFGWITADQYAGFCRSFGRDVLRWAGFYLLRDIRELHMTLAAAAAAVHDPAYRDHAAYRVRCLRGDEGPRQWRAWRPLDRVRTR
ncbi:hypothetical protein BJY24_006028 [Nocardia transvalensis]|uniref:Aminoglycoside phosphotransferase domain-containing protein n=1 Tax=Nocardia transvalensis TaxID=37333 RepID=A0A7W9UL31_9NOCA|nr:phosphotransferase [Nocardia transvalensis]MBB5917116.1 hypothetical protein [Nocardia transvalensis]